ncbi:2,3,4,5-tetrahydropyridine-2,6-dicarboxylate N-succinyltransferase [Oceanospirillaceae bacterium]|jgi:2,3,4,5-tetrahydropyridine-2-carboxylate N-succinyltransferase|nr:2,3,4,5-tetrahydropyridine-2,6-dicarboxylate N-succinyltransferase [Oceanospirillaceae bacterium]MDC0084458.1 2,3,4,5-tetrahydropyridine-2,6-dicarboxylate N-succinyltransferase [Oceanospirillaceae bacterium]
MSHFSFAFGIGSQSSQGEWLEVFYPQPILNPSVELVTVLTDVLGSQIATGNHALSIDAKQASALAKACTDAGELDQAKWLTQAANAGQPMVISLLETDSGPQTTPEVYLKLQLLSAGLKQPNSMDLNGIFGLLPNVAWTNEGAIAIEDLTQRQMDARLRGELLHVNAVDKFPRMADYAVPKGIRIGDASRVRLGAHVAEGTTVMHEGFINFNAGTLGHGMIEGRISAGVTVGHNSDLGGGCSTMGTLSGGGKIVNSVGQDSLIGANAGMGIPIGDRCIIEAGLYITGGSKVALLDARNELVDTVKAATLAGKPDLLFRRNSLNGRIEVKPNGTAVELNSDLHSNN